VGSCGSDIYIRAQDDHAIHRRTHRAIERMGEGMHDSHFVGCHPLHLRYGKLSAKD
jgi:hypothetical protein